MMDSLRCEPSPRYRAVKQPIIGWAVWFDRMDSISSLNGCYHFYQNFLQHYSNLSCEQRRISITVCNLVEEGILPSDTNHRKDLKMEADPDIIFANPEKTGGRVPTPPPIFCQDREFFLTSISLAMKNFFNNMRGKALTL